MSKMKRYILFLSFLLIIPQWGFAQGGIQKTRQATQQACSNTQMVVAASFSHQRGDTATDMIDKVCSDSPVGITKLVILPDGFIPIIRNFDSKRKVVGVAFTITTYNGLTKTKLESKYDGNLLTNYLEPGAEMQADSLKPFGPIKTAKQTVYLIEFSSVRFDTNSEGCN